MNHILPVLFALFLDKIFGDPRHFPHPIKYIGLLANKLESILYINTNKKLAGLTLVLSLYSIAFLVTVFILKIFSNSPILVFFIESIIIYTTIALNDLIKHSQNVRNALKKEGLEEARKQVSMIVGRDTKSLDKTGILNATFESLAENFSDGVIGPLLFALIGGAPFAILYKAINTCDSMFGYKNSKYIEFGYFSAKIDDFANFAPARLAALSSILACFFLKLSAKNAFFTMIKDSKKHASPNSGFPESTFAGAFGIKIGGPQYYEEVLFDKEFIGISKNIITEEIVQKAEKLAIFSTYIFIFLYCLLFFIANGLLITLTS